ncbi:MAG: hypothetical protein V3S11_05460, partial [Elusimicrobiota bacterium]
MALDKKAIERIFAAIQGDLINVHRSLKDRGGKYFQRPLLLGGLMVFCAHFYVFQAAGKRSIRINNEYGAAQATITYADEYKSLKLRLDAIKRKLPRVKNPSNWLLKAIRSTLREEGIVPLATSPP